MGRDPIPEQTKRWLEQKSATSLRSVDSVLEGERRYTRVIPRPILDRYLRRIKGGELGVPTDAEKRDAIAILEAGEPYDALYLEAERTFEEASR